jgi:serine/threonine protein kinase
VRKSPLGQSTEDAPVTASPTTSSLKVLRQLSSDAHSEAFLAQVRGFESPMVVRVVKPELALNVDRMNRFIAEARLLTEVSSKALLQVRSAGRMKDGRVYVLTEFAEGEPLANRNPLELEALVEIGLPLCEALAALHRSGLVLGALTAHEILLTANGPKLDASLAPLSRAPGATAATDVRALASLLQSLAGPAIDQGLFDTSTREGISQATTAAELLAAFEAVRQRWSGETRVRGSQAPGEAVVESVTIDEPDLSGQTLGPYELHRILGEGAMGRVYLGKHNRIGREAAIKVLKAEHARHKDLVQRFIQEATAVNAIKNEHIVEVHDFGEELTADGSARVYCVMEVLRGRALSEEMERGPLGLQRSCRIVQQLTKALGAAHALGVVHRDVKPENVYLHERDGDPDYVKVLDFGVAKLLKPLASLPTSSTQAGVVIGTPEYMAPEQALGISTDLRVDIYAVGLVLYELLAHRQPFQGDTFGKLVVEITTRPPPPLPERSAKGELIPAGLKQIISRCLEKKPEDRWNSAAELAAALEPYVHTGNTVITVLPQLPEDELLAGRASSVPKLMAAFAAALLLGAAAFWALRNPEPVAEAAVPREPARVAAVVAPVQVTLEVSSQPAGAKVVRLDTQQAVGVTPLKFSAEKAESSIGLRLELPGHQSVEREVSLSANVALSIDLPVELRPVEPAKPPAERKPKAPKKVTRDGQLDPFSN